MFLKNRRIRDIDGFELKRCFRDLRIVHVEFNNVGFLRLCNSRNQQNSGNNDIAEFHGHSYLVLKSKGGGSPLRVY